MRIALIILAAVAGLPVNASESRSATLTSDLSYGHALQDPRSVQGVLEVTPPLEFSSPPNELLVLSARLRLDLEDRLEPDRPDTTSLAPLSKPLVLGNTGTIELRDLYWERRFKRGLLRSGKQQIVWGRLDGIKVLDVVNPQDFREFIIDDFADSRISLWSAYLDVRSAHWRYEFALVPDSSAHAIPASDAWFALRAPRFQFGNAGDANDVAIDTDRPGHQFRDAGFGLRLSQQFGGTELALIAYSGLDPEPLGRSRIASGQPVIERYFKRRETFGLSADMGLGISVLRTEYAYQPGRRFNRNMNGQLSAVALEQHRVAIGLDVTGPWQSFINIQYLLDHVRAAPSNLVRPARDQVATLFIRRAFVQDTVTFTARWYHSLSDHDSMLVAGIRMDLSDATSLDISAQSSSGTRRGLFGQFENQDRLLVSLQHTF